MKVGRQKRKKEKERELDWGKIRKSRKRGGAILSNKQVEREKKLSEKGKEGGENNEEERMGERRVLQCAYVSVKQSC